jgi:tetratricopeptide (TPR) repeat protein
VFAVLASAGALFGQAGECSSALERGRTAYQQRQFAAAVSHFAEARIQCPDPKQALLPLAQSQLMAQRLEESLKTLDALLALEPRNIDAWKLKGDVLYLLGREPDAERSLRTALEIDSAHVPSRYALGRIYYQQNRIADATQLFRELIERDPKDYRAHDNLALCYAALGQDADALKHFLKALDLVHKDHPEYDTVYANAANFFVGRGDYKKAFQLGAEAAKRGPDSARNFFLTGKALASMEQYQLSVRWFRHAAELEPTYAEAYYWLATVYRKLGRTGDASEALERFRELSKGPKLRR